MKVVSPPHEKVGITLYQDTNLFSPPTKGEGSVYASIIVCFASLGSSTIVLKTLPDWFHIYLGCFILIASTALYIQSKRQTVINPVTHCPNFIQAPPANFSSSSVNTTTSDLSTSTNSSSTDSSATSSLSTLSTIDTFYDQTFNNAKPVETSPLPESPSVLINTKLIMCYRTSATPDSAANSALNVLFKDKIEISIAPNGGHISSEFRANVQLKTPKQPETPKQLETWEQIKISKRATSEQLKTEISTQLKTFFTSLQTTPDSNNPLSLPPVKIVKLALETLSVSYSILCEMIDTNLIDCTELTTLHITSRISAEELTHLIEKFKSNKLEELSIEIYDDTNFPVTIADALTNLRVLDISSPSLKTIPLEAFSFWKQLKKLTVCFYKAEPPFDMGLATTVDTLSQLEELKCILPFQLDKTQKEESLKKLARAFPRKSVEVKQIAGRLIRLNRGLFPPITVKQQNTLLETLRKASSAKTSVQIMSLIDHEIQLQLQQLKQT